MVEIGAEDWAMLRSYGKLLKFGIALQLLVHLA